MLLIIYKNDIIEKIMSVSEVNNTLISALIKNKIITAEHKYISQEKTNATIGLNIKALNKDGSVMSLSEQIAKGYYKLKEGYAFKNGKIEKMDEVELIERGIKELDVTQKIITDDNGLKQIVEKTQEEKIAEGLITTTELKEIEKQQAIARLQQIDIESIRPLRADVDGTATEHDYKKLHELNEEANSLRELLK